MELNLFGAIPFLLGDRKGEIESAFKYFLIQVFGSIVFLFSIICGTWVDSLPLRFFILTGLFIKLGVAPFHFWVPSVLAGCSIGAI